MSADYQLSPRDYLAIAKRWALAMILTFGVVLATSVVVAMLLPRVYESTGTLLAEAPQISGDVVRSAPSAGNAEQKVQALGRRIMTRESLLRIATEHQVFEAVPGQAMADTDVVEAMRNSIDVKVLIGNMPSWERPNNNFAFNVTFQHGNPDKALEITSALIRLFLESSVRERVEQASRANEFLSQEADRVQARLEDLDRRIAAYKRAQGGAGRDDGQAVALSNIQSLESELRAAEREQRVALDELQTLEVELAGARSGVMMPGVAGTPGPSVAEQELERARAELARIRGIYTEDHPDVRAQQRQIETLERSLKAGAGAGGPTRDTAAAQARLAVSRLEAQVSTARARANLLADQQRSLRNTIGQLRTQVSRAPQVERDLAALQRDHDATRAQYEDLRAKQLTAQTVQNLEGEQQGERFSLLEPPLLPEYPVKPNRKKLVALGFFLALACAVGIAILLELMFARVRGVNALTAMTGQRPLVVIPYIATDAEARSSQLLRKRFVAMAAGLALLSIAVVHLFIVPLHTLLLDVFSRLG